VGPQNAGTCVGVPVATWDHIKVAPEIQNWCEIHMIDDKNALLCGGLHTRTFRPDLKPAMC